MSDITLQVDPVSGTIGLLALVLPGLRLLWTLYAGRKVLSTWSEIPRESLGGQNPSVSVEYQGKQVPSPYAVLLVVKNTGRAAVKPEDFDGGLLGCQLRRISQARAILSVHPERYAEKVEINKGGELIHFLPLLLKEGEEIRISVLTDCAVYATDWGVSSLLGVKVKEGKTDLEEAHSRAWLVGYFMGIGALLLIQFFSSLVLK